MRISRSVSVDGAGGSALISIVLSAGGRFFRRAAAEPRIGLTARRCQARRRMLRSRSRRLMRRSALAAASAITSLSSTLVQAPFS